MYWCLHGNSLNKINFYIWFIFNFSFKICEINFSKSSFSDSFAFHQIFCIDCWKAWRFDRWTMKHNYYKLGFDVCNASRGSATTTVSDSGFWNWSGLIQTNSHLKWSDLIRNYFLRKFFSDLIWSKNFYTQNDLIWSDPIFFVAKMIWSNTKLFREKKWCQVHNTVKYVSQRPSSEWLRTPF